MPSEVDKPTLRAPRSLPEYTPVLLPTFVPLDVEGVLLHLLEKIRSAKGDATAMLQLKGYAQAVDELFFRMEPAREQ